MNESKGSSKDDGPGVRSRPTDHTKVLFKLIAENKTHVLNASRAQGSLAHKDAHVTKPTGLESASGMNINRH